VPPSSANPPSRSAARLPLQASQPLQMAGMTTKRSASPFLADAAAPLRRLQNTAHAEIRILRNTSDQTGRLHPVADQVSRSTEGGASISGRADNIARHCGGAHGEPTTPGSPRRATFLSLQKRFLLAQSSTPRRGENLGRRRQQGCSESGASGLRTKACSFNVHARISKGPPTQGTRR